ncbi:hypothetical protein GCM10022410_13210 [Amphibacillus indicireducens]|uniref:Uncharacterized protein n=1 Tax=Amphibacillus indicireducens TaxID=1076330 RepID=A0ABP7VJL1_9BACI
MRFCLKSTGPRESILIAIIRIRKMGDNKMMPNSDNKMSISLLMVIVAHDCFPPVYCYLSVKLTFLDLTFILTEIC